ncbi:YciI family protein [Tabrizicola fusiformis]|uniref:YciI family protein n=1 Tax=Tabrizicola sp. SY72 TaxID=2741673 RepID=UPI001571C70E|nr:YciI family protein [Tabrizicola sp. SY72]NTT85071.1 YciI family protein [Tabrizicola sp. SY72]
MKYMALIYEDSRKSPGPDSPEFAAFMGGYVALARKLQEDGNWISGEGLKGPETATCLRRRGGKVETMDGPFAETREHLGGFYLFEARDLDQALAYAAMIPSVDWGTVEIRPVMDYS